MTIIAPSLLASDFSRLAEMTRLAEEGGADWIHLDVMDGRFVPNITIGPPVISAIRKTTTLPLDTHLMIVDPDNHLEAFREAGADHITVHQEACTHLHRTVSRIKELGAKAGVSINPATPCASLADILGEVDLVLIMTVNPGFGGQSFIKNSLKKIREMRGMIDAAGRDIVLEVDGGIDPHTTPLVTKAGATALVAGTSVFKSSNVAGAIAGLRAASVPFR